MTNAMFLLAHGVIEIFNEIKKVENQVWRIKETKKDTYE